MCHSPNKIDKSTINQLNEVDDSSIDYSEEYESIPTWWAQFLTLYRSCKIYCTSSKVYEKIQCTIIFSKIWKMWILFVFNLWISFLLSFFLFFFPESNFLLFTNFQSPHFLTPLPTLQHPSLFQRSFCILPLMLIFRKSYPFPAATIRKGGLCFSKVFMILVFLI